MIIPPSINAAWDTIQGLLGNRTPVNRSRTIHQMVELVSCHLDGRDKYGNYIHPDKVIKYEMNLKYGAVLEILIQAKVLEDSCWDHSTHYSPEYIVGRFAARFLSVGREIQQDIERHLWNQMDTKLDHLVHCIRNGSYVEKLIFSLAEKKAWT